MSRRVAVVRRCLACKMHLSLCICALIPRLATRTRLLLVIHRAEQRKSTNTGLLAAACLENSAIVVRGEEATGHAALPLTPTERAILLYPAEDALPLPELAASLRRSTEPITLVVPDGNWRQAAKVRKRVPGLAELPCVALPVTVPSRYRLRTGAHDHSLATLEAIARVLGVLEGPHVEAAMLVPFRAMVERTLWARGRFDEGRVTGGIPEGVQRHDPESGTARCKLTESS